MLGISINKNRVNYLTVESKRNDIIVSNYGTKIYDTFNEALSNALKDILEKENLHKSKSGEKPATGPH